jgi:membrane-associated phospholipid phosphatase
MTWDVKFDLMPKTAKASGAATKETDGTDDPRARIIYPDHFWGDPWWGLAREASRYGAAVANITLPPIPTWDKIVDELKELMTKQESQEREIRRPEILEENEGPPAYYRRMLYLDDPGNPHTRALLGMIVSWSVPPIMFWKSRLKRARPPQLEPRLRPMVDIPRHAAYPSGHSTQSHLIALVLEQVTGRADIGKALFEAADRIAQNREYAGIHYASDSAAGVVLARALMPLFIEQHQDEVGRARDEWS